KPPVEETLAIGNEPWVQFYLLRSKQARAAYLERVEGAGTKVIVLTVDTPVLGNRQRPPDFLVSAAGGARGMARRLTETHGLGSFLDRDVDKTTLIGNDPAATWSDLDDLRASTKMKLVVKGIVTAEDAKLCLDHGVDGVIVSNHGGRQEESLR